MESREIEKYQITSNSTSNTSGKKDKKFLMEALFPYLNLTPSISITSISNTNYVSTKSSGGLTKSNRALTKSSRALSKSSRALSKSSRGLTKSYPESTKSSPNSTKSSPDSTDSSSVSIESTEFSEVYYQEENIGAMGKYNKKIRSRSSYRRRTYSKRHKQERECTYQRTITINQPATDNLPSDFSIEHCRKNNKPRTQKHVQFKEPSFHRSIAAESSKSKTKVALPAEQKNYSKSNLECVTLPCYNVPYDFNIDTRVEENNSPSKEPIRRQSSHQRSKPRQRPSMDPTDKPKNARKPSKTTNPVSSNEILTSSDDKPRTEQQNNSFNFPGQRKFYEDFLKGQLRQKFLLENLDKFDLGVVTTDDEESNISVENKVVQKDDSKLIVSDGEVVYDNNTTKATSTNCVAVVPIEKKIEQVDKISTEPVEVIPDFEVRPKLLPKRKLRRVRRKSTYSRRDYELHYKKHFPYMHDIVFGPRTHRTIVNTMGALYGCCDPKSADSGTQKDAKERRERAQNIVNALNEQFNTIEREQSQSTSTAAVKTTSVTDGSKKSVKLEPTAEFVKFEETKRRLEDRKPESNALSRNDEYDTPRYMIKNRLSSIHSNPFKKNRSAQWNSLDFMESNDKKSSQNLDNKQSSSLENKQIAPYKKIDAGQLSNLSNRSSEDRIDQERMLNALKYLESAKLNDHQQEQRLEVKTTSQINSVPSNADYCKQQNLKLSIPDDKKISNESRFRKCTRKMSDKSKQYEMQPYIKQENNLDDEKQLIDDEVPRTDMELTRFIPEPKVKTEPQTSLRKFSDHLNLNPVREKSSEGLLPIDEKLDELDADIGGMPMRQLGTRMQRDSQPMDTHPNSSGYQDNGIVKHESIDPTPTPVIEVHDEDRLMSELLADQSFDQTGGDTLGGVRGRKATAGAAGDTRGRSNNARNTRYVLTRINEFEDFTAYEILRKTMRKPRTSVPKTERVFILKHKHEGIF